MADPSSNMEVFFRAAFGGFWRRYDEAGMTYGRSISGMETWLKLRHDKSWPGWLALKKKMEEHGFAEKDVPPAFLEGDHPGS